MVRLTEEEKADRKKENEAKKEARKAKKEARKAKKEAKQARKEAKQANREAQGEAAEQGEVQNHQNEAVQPSAEQIQDYERLIRQGAERATAIGYATVNPNLQHMYMNREREEDINVQDNFANHELFDLEPDPKNGGGLVKKSDISLDEMFNAMFPENAGDTTKKYYLDCADFCQLLQSYANIQSGIVDRDGDFSFSQHRGSHNPSPSEFRKVRTFPANKELGSEEKAQVRGGPNGPETVSGESLWESIPIGSRVTFTDPTQPATSDHRSQNTIKIGENELANNGFNGDVTVFTKESIEERGYRVSEFSVPAHLSRDRARAQSRSAEQEVQQDDRKPAAIEDDRKPAAIEDDRKPAAIEDDRKPAPVEQAQPVTDVAQIEQILRENPAVRSAAALASIGVDEASGITILDQVLEQEASQTSGQAAVASPQALQEQVRDIASPLAQNSTDTEGRQGDINSLPKKEGPRQEQGSPRR